MDAPEDLALTGDTTFAMAREAVLRGWGLYAYTPKDLSLDEDWQPRAIVRELHAESDESGERFYRSGGAALVALRDFDVVLVRQDPPYDMEYLTATWFLERLKTKTEARAGTSKRTLVVNDPTALRDAPEKLWAGALKQYVPRTIASDNREQIKAFAKTCGAGVVVKPLYGNGGRGVVRIEHTSDDSKLDSSLDSLLNSWREDWEGPPQVQEYLPAVQEGDKRVLLIGGEIAGVMNRVPKAGEFRANLNMGARAELAELSAREEEIAHKVAEILTPRGILVAGLDIIGGFLTEVNLTSPTGFRFFEKAASTGQAGGVACSALFWDAVEKAVRDAG